jgi:hypothetical protein
MTKDEQDEIINENPMMGDYSLNKRWYEESVFRN